MTKPFRSARMKVALAAGLAVVALCGAAQAELPPDKTQSHDRESIVRVEVLVHDPHSKPPGDRKVAVVAFDDFTVVGFRVYRQYGDGLGPIRRVEDRVVKEACRASKWACIALTRELVVEVGYR